MNWQKIFYTALYIAFAGPVVVNVLTWMWCGQPLTSYGHMIGSGIVAIVATGLYNSYLRDQEYKNERW